MIQVIPREIIKRNLMMSNPPRIGFDFDRGRRNDFIGVGISASASWQPRRWQEGTIEYYDDEWGNIWHRIIGKSQKGEIYEPALSDWADLETYKLPNLAAPERFLEAKQIFQQNPDLYHLGSLDFPFSICRYLRKLELYFQDLYLERDKIDLLHDRVTSLLEEMIFQYAKAGADGIFFAEDWGLQDRLMINPELWREIFKPLYLRLCQRAHSLNLHVLMHSCGHIGDIMDDLAEVGINCFQFDQPGLYGLERLADKLKELKICLFSPVDIQKVLPTGDRELIRSEAKKMKALFGERNGGFIARNYCDLPGIGVAAKWDHWAYEVFVDEQE
ncbi:MAG: uroporphyrinogen decarboxylase family protein [bacterium]|jgi:uroporphyrinogen decarboxylase|nr:uroporphyrinogen decarboxylase family protein [bacterium]MDD3805641.1 uroporphyrinogen decarboxylase family protein [bacterium]MDD4152361.1 uroporphyrinogen decarboxylase family protein [bacterium]MDD4557970.1 uroporphyrinogen decarboxylase family protein [bacterium]